LRAFNLLLHCHFIGNPEVWINPDAKCAPVPQKRIGLLSRAHRQAEIVVPGLLDGKILCGQVSASTVLANVFRYTNTPRRRLPPSSLVIRVAKWVFAQEKLPGQCFTDHRHAEPAGGVGILNSRPRKSFALSADRYSRLTWRSTTSLCWPERPPFDLDIVCSAGALRWEACWSIPADPPRQARNAANNFTLKSYDLLIILVRSIGSHYSHGRQMAGSKPNRTCNSR
jgi:hypothetical protein